ncbi:hypothetical protein [Streptomyces sp. NPDC059874]
MIGQTSVDTVWAVDRIVEQNLLFWSDPSFGAAIPRWPAAKAR